MKEFLDASISNQFIKHYPQFLDFTENRIEFVKQCIISSTPSNLRPPEFYCYNNEVDLKSLKDIIDTAFRPRRSER